MSTALLQAHTLSHGFDTQLFHDVSFVLHPLQSMAIVGRSGCGKSTLMHITSTFIKPDEGSVTLLGHDLYTLDEAAIESLRRYDIGIIFQFHYLFKGMSAMENIEVATMLSGEAIDEVLLEKLEIKELMSQKIGELSGGQQQRVSIARVLSKKPRIIFADEPTGNLDTETADLVMDVLLDYVKESEAGLLLVTHDNAMAARCDSVFRLEEKMLKVKA
ncbi:MAG TPA: ABC transporter ATP-binding protein [Sulfurovum sp.]|jgi:putative ABC transport system ATP-binding protein|nr:MAG: ABC transporter ATP-binding protein [Sulfurovum sp. 35-42-20]OYY55958.1 MAG: ABC transporter ATP-binding protein [Sulfurovum sp. 28-43-6]OYZ23841.1 MAG: ABC transporter ATP-binding protein [Sulfurovum sp. 16-42-52]OYZ49468.1 MAG: ABC transporter ATP-binding protein [Sulfurovum sp. 24-42-9]OZA43353.1 MAG: ABC transporter ATP-binding protein [Sulfurovum sp. 17-42-90]OZA60610.1 MAG: ABC transporter ATP-binding protein [Sulfurovum sp. 39-42-12]HQR74619.1 ABC transporter ATP-binding protei